MGRMGHYVIGGPLRWWGGSAFGLPQAQSWLLFPEVARGGTGWQEGAVASAVDDGLGGEKVGSGGGGPSSQPPAVGQLQGQPEGGEGQGAQAAACCCQEEGPSAGQDMEGTEEESGPQTLRATPKG